MREAKLDPGLERVTRRGVPYVSTGELLRGHIRRGTPLGRTAQAYMDRGELVPDNLVLPLVLGLLTGPEAAKGYVLDGFPRTYREAVAADEAAEKIGGVADAVVFLDVPRDELIRRLETACDRVGPGR